MNAGNSVSLGPGVRLGALERDDRLDPHALDPAPGVQMELAEITGADSGDSQDFGHGRAFPRGLPAGLPPTP